MVGALLAVGDGRRPVTWPHQVLDGRRRELDPTAAFMQGRRFLERVREEVRRRVNESQGVTLEWEIQRVGRW